MYFTFIDGNEDGIFSLDAASGDLTLAKSLLHITPLSYSLTIQANDSVNIKEMTLAIEVATGTQINKMTIVL